MQEQRCPLDDVLDLLRVRGALMANLRGSGTWGLKIPRTPRATLHVVTAGTCWVRVSGEAPRELLAGDLVLLPTGAAHVLSSDPAAATRAWTSVAKEQSGNPAHECVVGGGGNSTHAICAGFSYDHDVAQPLLSLLPPMLFMSGQAVTDDNPVQSTVRVLRHELNTRSSGSNTVIDRLIDVLFVQVIRAWSRDERSAGTSWLHALRDPLVARALAVMHARPATPWTIDALAREVSMSRATLTRRFTTLVGEPPLAYLTRWRMDLAARQLRETTNAVSSIAHGVGYTSEFAFSRAFTRLRGVAPGRYRTEARRQSLRPSSSQRRSTSRST
jgi:AraC-like DNA-binding protein